MKSPTEKGPKSFSRLMMAAVPLSILLCVPTSVLGQSGGGTSGALSQNDLLLAHTARELGWCVITRDNDFARIRQQLKGLRVEAPYPRQPTS